MSFRDAARCGAFVALTVTLMQPVRAALGPIQWIYGQGTKWSRVGEVRTYARVAADGEVVEVGFELPMDAIKSPPAMMGPGPAGSQQPLDWPSIVRQQTWFNHLEIHWNPNGHEPAIFMVPHFDFHFYHMPEAEVWGIQGIDPLPPDSAHLPAGYIYPGPAAGVPQMGVHTFNPAEITPPFRAVMIAGFWDGQMNFVEPMITRERLLTRQSFTLPVPRPAFIDATNRFPTTMRAVYQPRLNTYYIGFADFVTIPGRGYDVGDTVAAR
ncbi:MAG TPA: hypothetical protein VGM37_04115 [Armatimonadota bacterium]|jgi:hypothetical protein